MTVDFIIGIMAETIRTMLMIAGPVLLVGLLLGVTISLLQAVTQVQEMTLVFVPKIVGCLIVLVIALPWMLNLLLTFAHNIFTNIPNYIR